MPPREQIPPLERLVRRPPSLEGGVDLTAELIDNRRGIVRLRHGEVEAQFRAAGLAVPYPSGLERLLASDPEIELVVVDRAPPGLRNAADARGISYLDVHGRGRVIAPGLVYVASP